VVKESISDKWLSIFLLLCVLYISPWMLGFAGWYDNQPYRDILFYIPFQQLYKQLILEMLIITTSANGKAAIYVCS
jgi:hypothetical protein